MEYLYSPMDSEHLPEGSSYHGYEELELVREQLHRLLQTEAQYPDKYVACEVSSPSEQEHAPLDEWRKKICQWAFRVVDHFLLDREVVAVGMEIFDRYLANSENPHSSTKAASCKCPTCQCRVDSRSYQLAAMTSLYLAIKLFPASSSDLEFARHKQFKLSTFVELSRGQFDAQDICSMERTILSTLKWKVNPPTAMTFVQYFLTLLPSREEFPSSSRGYYELVLHVLRELSRYMTELAVCLGGNSAYQPSSQLAFASIQIAMDILTTDALPLCVRESFAKEVHQICRWKDFCSIFHIRQQLERSLWPDMLLDDNDQDGHPISMARTYGLLDMKRISRGRFGTPPGSPKTVQTIWSIRR